MTLACNQCGRCVRCRLAKKDPRYAALFGVESRSIPTPTPAKRPPTVPCKERGEPLIADECIRRGLSPLRLWVFCEHPDQPLGEIVCSCKGCGPPCSGYTAE